MIPDTYVVEAIAPTSAGWELHIAGEGVSQCRTLDEADRQIRDYLSLWHGIDEYVGRIILLVVFDDPDTVPARSLAYHFRASVRRSFARVRRWFI